jgi:tetratricopeptide (TPR) repeat protein
MPTPFSVFVCSTFSDLSEERDGVLESIRRLSLRHDSMEYFGARAERPIETCLEEVRASDLLVVIIGQKYGSLVPDLGISYSQAEYEEGFRLDKPSLVYMRDENAPVLLRHVERDPEKLRLLENWKQTLQLRHTVAKFAEVKDLAVQVAADLGRFLAEQRFSTAVTESSQAKGVPEAPLLEVLKKLGEAEVPEAEIPDRLAKAGDELLRLRDDLARRPKDQPEFARIRGEASTLIDKGELDVARATLNDGRLRARSLREDIARSEAGFLADEARVDQLQLNYDDACKKFEEATTLDPNNAQIWIGLGDVLILRNSLAKARRAFSAARDAAVRSGNDRDLSASYQRIGNVQFAGGILAGALKSYRESLAFIERLMNSDPSNTGLQRDLATLHNKIGDVQVDQNNLRGALDSYRHSLRFIDRLTKSDPSNVRWQYDLSVSYGKVGEVQQAQSDLDGALEAYRDTVVIFERLTKSDPGNAGWKYDLSISHGKVGEIQQARRDLADALKSYRRALGIVEGLAKSYPANAGWQHDLSVLYNKIGDLEVAQGNPANALSSYTESLTIRKLLAKSHPRDAGWQRDLAVSYEKIGDLQVTQEDFLGATKSYSDSFAIRDRLAKSDPDEVDWQRDLSVSYEKLGDSQIAQGDLTSALKSYNESLAIKRRFANSEPGNSSLQRSLSMIYAKLASGYPDLDDTETARQKFAAGRAFISKVLGEHPEWAELKQDLAWFEQTTQLGAPARLAEDQSP